MENQITIKEEYNTLDSLLNFLKIESTFEYSKDYDGLDVRTDANGLMEKSIFIKKSAMHGMKIYFIEGNTLQMDYMIPNKIMNAYFGKSKKRYKSIIEIITGKITEIALAPSQKKAFEEIEEVFKKAIA